MITADDDIMGGVPCVAGTRIPVLTVLGMLTAHNLKPAPILFDFPQLTLPDLIECVAFGGGLVEQRFHSDPPRWMSMLVSELMEQLDATKGLIGLRNTDGTARAFVLKATPDVVRLIEDLTMRADVPPAPDS